MRTYSGSTHRFTGSVTNVADQNTRGGRNRKVCTIFVRNERTILYIGTEFAAKDSPVSVGDIVHIDARHNFRHLSYGRYTTTYSNINTISKLGRAKNARNSSTSHSK